MNKEQFKYLPPNKRKKILLICDDIRVHSGVATVAKEIVIHTAQHFNWVNVGGAIKHQQKGKRFDLDKYVLGANLITSEAIFLLSYQKFEPIKIQSKQKSFYNISAIVR